MFLEDLNVDPNRYQNANQVQYGGSTAASPSMQMPERQMQTSNQKQTLPNLRSSGNSPVKRHPGNLDELKKLARDEFGV